MEDTKDVNGIAGSKRSADDILASTSPISGDADTISDSKRLQIEEAQQTNDAPSNGGDSGDSISIKVQFGKNSVNVTKPASTTVLELKTEIEKETGVPCANQKLLFKGQLKDDQTLAQTGLKNGSKLMVIGSKPADVSKAIDSAAAAAAAKGLDWDAPKKEEEPWADQPQHKKVIDKGKPDECWPGISGRQIPLTDAQTYIPGLYNSHGTKVRLTFRPEIQQLWIGSAANTQKVPYGSISKITAQEIKDTGYSIVKMQLGASTSSAYWLYFVPSQCVSSIKIRVLGVGSLLE